MDMKDEIVLNESDMRIKEIGRDKHLGGRVIVVQCGPKAPEEYRNDIFVAHVKSPEDVDIKDFHTVDGVCDPDKFETYEPDKCVVEFDRYDDGSYSRGHAFNTYRDSRDSDKYFDSEQEAVHQAAAYLSMINGMTKQEWSNSQFASWIPKDMFEHNMHAVSDDVFLTHRKDLKTSLYMSDYIDGDDYGSTVIHSRIHPKQSVTGQCLEVHDRGVDMDIPGFGKAYVRVGLPFGDDERQLVQRAVDAKAPVQLAVSNDGRSLLVNAGDLGKIVTRHEDVAIPHEFFKNPYQMSGGPSQSNSEISGTLIHLHSAREVVILEVITRSGTEKTTRMQHTAELKKDNGEHVLMDLHA